MKSEEMSMWRRLPEENQVDIFLKLPVNSILACRCVCKIWFNLLRNPKFIKNHLSRSIRYNNNPRLMIVQPQYGKNPIISSVDYKSISSSSPLELKVVSINYPFEDKEIEGIVTLGSCNGLICFGISTGKGIEAKNYICIWNPSTGEYKTIKLPVYECVAESSPKSNDVRSRYGFGYDGNIDDYKLVKMSFNESLLNRFPKLQTIQVYALGSKRWKTIECPDPYMFPSRQFNKMLPGLLFNGALHWSPGMTTNQGTNSEVIVCFDINSEKLMDVPLPEEPRLHLRSRNSYKQVGLLGDCLCVVFLYSFQADIWVMKDYGVSESWTKVLTISQLTMFIDPFLKPLWAFENGDVLVHSCEELSLCSQNNGIIKVLLHGNHPVSYVESLVSLKSDTYVKRSTTNGIRRNPSDRD